MNTTLSINRVVCRHHTRSKEDPTPTLSCAWLSPEESFVLLLCYYTTTTAVVMFESIELLVPTHHPTSDPSINTLSTPRFIRGQPKRETRLRLFVRQGLVCRNEPIQSPEPSRRAVELAHTQLNATARDSSIQISPASDARKQDDRRFGASAHQSSSPWGARSRYICTAVS